MYWSDRLIFIHVPRTGGTLLTDAFGSLPNVSKDVWAHRHARASTAREITGCMGARMIAVYRSDEDIARSFYEHCQDEDSCDGMDPWTQIRDATRAMTFDDFVRCGPCPTMGWYVDSDDVDILSWDEAYEASCEAFGLRPSVVRPRFLMSV